MPSSCHSMLKQATRVDVSLVLEDELFAFAGWVIFEGFSFGGCFNSSNFDHQSLTPRRWNETIPKVLNKLPLFFGSELPYNFWVSTLPETNIAPENRPLEKEIPIGTTIFRFYVSFKEGIYSFSGCFFFSSMRFPLAKNTSPKTWILVL